MFGEEAIGLVREALRIGPATLPAYNDVGVRAVVKEVRMLDAEQQTLVRHAEQSPALMASFLVNHACIERNRRCLLAYLTHRLKRLRGIVWELGTIPRELLPIFSPAEAAAGDCYADLVLAFKGCYPMLDFNASTSPQPPKDLFIYVRVLRPCGEIMTESGHPLKLDMDTTHYVRRSDVERLIAHGYLQHLVPN